MKLGHRVIAEDGQTVILDDRGLLQTWQEGNTDNVDSVSPLIINIYLPLETRKIGQALLRFRLLPFRTYSKGAASDGGSTITSTDGGGSTIASAGGGATSSTTTQGGSDVRTSYASEWSLYPSIYVPDAMTYASDHNHGIPDGTDLARAGGGSVTFSASGGHSHTITADHVHDVSIPGHTHDVAIPNHTHNVSIPNHRHSVNIPDHTHPIIYGIYTGTTPLGITVKINGTDRTTVLKGPFNNDQNNLSIGQYLSVGQWNTIELGSVRLGRIDASVFIQALMGMPQGN